MVEFLTQTIWTIPRIELASGNPCQRRPRQITIALFGRYLLTVKTFQHYFLRYLNSTKRSFNILEVFVILKIFVHDFASRLVE